MLRTILLVLFACLSLSRASAQGAAEINRFSTEFNKLLEYKDEKGIDKLLRSSNDTPAAAIVYFREIRFEFLRGKTDLQAKIDILKAAFKRVFDGTEVLEKLERWCDSQDSQSFRVFETAQRNLNSAWNYFCTARDNALSPRKMFEESFASLRQAAEQMQQSGNMVEAAEAWNLVAICGNRMPDKGVPDYQNMVWALERYLEFRDAWGWKNDVYYVMNQNSLKANREKLTDKSKDAEKRKGDGFAEGARGIDALVDPKVPEVLAPFEFALLDSWDDELDYCQRGGPVPAFWWSVSFPKDVKDVKLSGFRRMDLSIVREGANKFGMSTLVSDPKRLQAVDAGSKGKATKFFLDEAHKIPYGMFVWLGGDRERLGESEVNLAPAETNTNVYFRSAASWTASVGGETLTFYDDNTTGLPLDGDPYELPYTMHTIGYGAKNGNDDEPRAKAPLYDSMRIGKGPRMPFSEFVHIGDKWWHVARKSTMDGERVTSRPLLTDYLKLGKVKLVWSGPKPTQPVQLVIHGRGDYQRASFDIAAGKEVEVPSGEYEVAFGRILQGKGARVQMGTIYRGDSKSFTVEPGKTFELKMGAPFAIDFDRGGSATDVEIDATHVRLRESSGCVIAELHGMVVVPEVFASKMADGKGAKQIGKFLKFTDGEILNKAAEKYREIGLFVACMPMPEGCKDGTMKLSLKLPAAGMRVALAMKKHPLFGKLDPLADSWK